MGEYDFALAANVLEGIERIDAVIGTITAHTHVFSIGTWANAVTLAWSKAVQVEILRQAMQISIPVMGARANETARLFVLEVGNVSGQSLLAAGWR